MNRRAFLVLPLGLAAESLGPSVEVVPGPVNGVVLTRGGRRLLIYGDPRPSPASADQVLLTHCRRDVAWAAREVQRNGASVIAPAAEAKLLLEPESFWQSFEQARYHDYAMVDTKVAARSLPLHRTVRGGDRIEWQGLTIEVLDTPGYTPGAVSYLFDADGRRIACTGDLIYGDGQLLDLYSLQDAVPEAKLRGYHGYAARAGALIASLRAVASRKPDVLVPSRGPSIERPADAIERLIGRLKPVLREHFTTDALRWYFGDDNLRLRAGKLLEGEVPAWMPMAETMPLPPWLMAMGNSRLILSESGGAFLTDCGYDRVIEELKKLRADGRFRALEGIFITHYHDDHTDRADACAREFQCPVYFTAELRDILENPPAYRMPCLSPFPIRSGKPVEHGARLRWHEFEFAYEYFPGQTLLHDSLLVKKDGGGAVFFVGDSFSPSGMDDYCLRNRNFLGPEPGYLGCLKRLRRLQSDCFLVNQHIEPMFRFSPAQLDFMEQSLRRRVEAMQRLFPWPDINFGLDDQWVRLAPYETTVAPGRAFELQAVVWNHAPVPQEFRLRLNLPEGWKCDPPVYRLRAAAHMEKAATLRITPSPHAAGRFVVPLDVEFGSWRLREWAEAIVLGQ